MGWVKSSFGKFDGRWLTVEDQRDLDFVVEFPAEIDDENNLPSRAAVSLKIPNIVGVPLSLPPVP